MQWNEEYTKAVEPDLKKTGAYIASPLNGARWLMVDVTSPEILTDVKALICTRRKPKEGTRHGE